VAGDGFALRDWWKPGNEAPFFRGQTGILEALDRVREPLRLVRDDGDGAVALAMNGEIYAAPAGREERDLPLIGTVPPLYPEWLGDRAFAETHGCRFPYVVGAMARGLTTPGMVISAAGAGLMAFFGSAGLSLRRIEEALFEIVHGLGPDCSCWGANLIHNPNEPEAEDAVVDLFLRANVRRASASAFMSLRPAVVRFAARGLERDAEGRIRRRNFIFAKISRPEVAAHFMSPPPEEMLRELVATGGLDENEAVLAAQLPVAGDVTVEADSGGHTDNRPLTALFPTILALGNELTGRFGFDRNIRIGAAGGLGTPGAVAAAFNLGAAYVLTGSVNQCAVESGMSAAGREMLAGAGLADMAMAPAADMFEMGVKVQVLKRATLFSTRAQRLYELYRSCDGLDDIPPVERGKLESEVFRAPLARVWTETRAHFLEHDPAQVERAERDPKYLMALVFRWYLFMAARWAADGVGERRADYQIWCGPAMGAFNTWTTGSFLEKLENRTVVQIARNLLEGAAVVTRAQQLRNCGVAVPPSAFDFRPRYLD
jgi:trans-AT polyketide synthase, acyltransferase and oxidoreductase domains